jgi:transposase-like protein
MSRVPVKQRKGRSTTGRVRPCRGFAAMKEWRVQAAILFEQDVAPAEIARRLGVGRQIVSDWRNAWRRSGRDGLRGAGRAGRPGRSLQLLTVREPIRATRTRWMPTATASPVNQTALGETWRQCRDLDPHTNPVAHLCSGAKPGFSQTPSTSIRCTSASVALVLANGEPHCAPGSRANKSAGRHTGRHRPARSAPMEFRHSGCS